VSRRLEGSKEGDRRRALPEDRHHPNRPAIRVKIEGYVTTIPFRHGPHLRGGLPHQSEEAFDRLPLLQADRFRWTVI